MYNPYNPYTFTPMPAYQVMPSNGSMPYAPSIQPAMQKMEVVRVSGEKGASAYQMPPNSSALLLDEAEPIVWLKVTDGAGYPTITPYKITPYVEEKPEDTLAAMDKRIKRLEDMLSEPDTATAKSKRGKSADTAD